MENMNKKSASFPENTGTDLKQTADLNLGA